MLGLRESKTEKAKDVLKEVVSYADELARDDRLRSDLRSALGHGAAATKRLQADSGAPGLGERLASDRKLRKSLRSMLDDLDHAAGRARRRTSHRVRNALLLLGGSGMIVASVPGARRWISRHLSPSHSGTARQGRPVTGA